MSWQFWAAAGTGTAALLAFALSRGGAEGGDLYADGLVAAAVVASSPVTDVTVLAALAVIVCVVWAQRARTPGEAAPQE